MSYSLFFFAYFFALVTKPCRIFWILNQMTQKWRIITDMKSRIMAAYFSLELSFYLFLAYSDSSFLDYLYAKLSVFTKCEKLIFTFLAFFTSFLTNCWESDIRSNYLRLVPFDVISVVDSHQYQFCCCYCRWLWDEAVLEKEWKK